jgi:NAD+ kinase
VANTIGIVVNQRKSQVLAPLEELDNWLENKRPNAEFLLCTQNSPYITKTFNHIKTASLKRALNESQLIITLGGDGTILRTIHEVGMKQTPILGVNLGGLGFLAETPPERFIPHIKKVINKQYTIEDRSLLECTVRDDGYQFYALNDIVFDKAGFSRVIEIITTVDKQRLNAYVADALILSTPTGSTGYSLSAGGPIVIPQTKVFLINPICPHSLTNRPVVVSDKSEIKIEVFTEHKIINIFRDGEMISQYPSGKVFIIKKAPFFAKLIKLKKDAFYDTLHNKLHWGEDFRDKNRWSYNREE